ncbi:MAG: MarR family winged helix-turn-helix transcriptional regulator [Lachnospiraceae bacterium]
MNIRQRLNKTYNELSGLYHDISVKLGLSDSESMVMYMLYDTQEPLTQSDIVKATGLSKQTLNSAIRKLEKEEIIILEKLNEKSKKIVMTDKGRILIAQKIKPLVDMEDRVLDSWKEEDRLKYLELIEKFKEQFEEEVNAYDKRQ